MTTSKPPVVLIGVGEMGGVFAKALLRAGHTVVPVTRTTPIDEVASAHPEPLMVLVTVGEADLDDVLASLPNSWKTGAVLIQNELLPRDWQRHGIADPTVAVVWFEKKPGIDTNVVVPTPIAGPHAATLVTALSESGIDAFETSTEHVADELVGKNLYILVANIAGLETGGSVSDLWANNEQLARNVGDEVLAIQEHLIGRPIDADAMYDLMLGAFRGDPDHGTTGRSAPKRLARALRHAEEAGIDVPALTGIAQSHGIST